MNSHGEGKLDGAKPAPDVALLPQRPWRRPQAHLIPSKHLESFAEAHPTAALEAEEIAPPLFGPQQCHAAPTAGWGACAGDVPALGTPGASLAEASPPGSAPRLQGGPSTAASCPAPGKAAQENRTPYLIWQMGNYSSCRCLLLHPSRCGAPFVIVCESRKGGHRAEWELIAWMPAGLGRQPGLWVIANYSFSGRTQESRTPGSLQQLPSYWENWSAPRGKEGEAPTGCDAGLGRGWQPHTFTVDLRMLLKLLPAVGKSGEGGFGGACGKQSDWEEEKRNEAPRLQM